MTTPRFVTSKKSVVYFRYFRVDERARHWGMFCTTCGQSRIAPGAPYPPVEHPPSHHFDWEHGRRLSEYHIVYLSEGSGLLETDKMTIRVGAGDAILLLPRMWHRYKPDPSAGWHEHWVGFSGESVQRIFRAGFFSRTNPVVRVRAETMMLECFRQMFQNVKENIPALQQVLAGHATLLLSLIRSSSVPGSHGGGVEQGPSQMVEQARSMLVSTQTREMGLKEMAKQLNVSYSTFRRTFREHTGVSPHQYRLHLKVSAARELLRSTTLSVKEIGYRCGFEDEQYFCRLFKQQTSSTPTEFRKR
jgi:AraC-like DNA-binding protein